MKRKYQAKPKKKCEEAKQQIHTLFEQAEQRFPQDPVLANRYVQLARKIAMKVKLRLPAGYQRRFCKHCYTYLVPHKNCRVRIRNNKVVYSCFTCKKFMRFPYRPKRKKT